MGVVQLKSGSPNMTVIDNDIAQQGEHIKVAWFRHDGGGGTMEEWDGPEEAFELRKEEKL